MTEERKPKYKVEMKFLKQLFCRHKNLHRFEGNFIVEHIFCKDCCKCLTSKKIVAQAKKQAKALYEKFGLL